MQVLNQALRKFFFSLTAAPLPSSPPLLPSLSSEHPFELIRGNMPRSNKKKFPLKTPPKSPTLIGSSKHYNDSNTKQEQKVILQRAIASAKKHEINLKEGTPNSADGNCAIESTIFNLNDRDCFVEKFIFSPDYYRRIWMTDMMNRTSHDKTWNIYTVQEWEDGWAEMMESGVYERGIFGDLMLLAIACGVQKFILIFNTSFDSPHDPIYVCDPRKFGVQPDSQIPIVLAYDLSHYESMHPVGHQDTVKTEELVEKYLSGHYQYGRKDLPFLLHIDVEDDMEEKSCNLEATANDQRLNSAGFKTVQDSLPEYLRGKRPRDMSKEEKKEYNNVKTKLSRAKKSKEKDTIREVREKREAEAKASKRLRETSIESKERKNKDAKAKASKRSKETIEEGDERRSNDAKAKGSKRSLEKCNKIKELTDEEKDSKRRKAAENRTENMKTSKLYKIARTYDVMEFEEKKNDQYKYDNLGGLKDGIVCKYCNAYRWKSELKTFCCEDGKISLPKFMEPSKDLQKLLSNKHVFGNSRMYNNIFSMASLGTDNKPEVGASFKVLGKMYHRIGGLKPDNNEKPKFAQIYFYDTDNQTKNRLNQGNGIKEDLVEKIQSILQRDNPYINSFKAALELDLPNHKLILHADSKMKPSEAHSRTYNLPTGSEVAVLMPGENRGNLDVIIETKGGALKHINGVHRSYDALHYVLLLPYGDDGFQPGLKALDGVHTVSINQFYSYHLQMRTKSFDVLLRSGRLSQQYIADQYAKVERFRMTWVFQNQKTIKVEKYQGLIDANSNGDIESAGQNVILPPSITGSPRWYTERYQDAMTITRTFGKPDLFITFTCNPKWPEIKNSLQPDETAFDRPDICARVFKMKSDQLLKEIIDNGIFGRTVAHVDTIEWQKRKGLPHLHLLVTLAEEDKIRNPTDIDKIVSAELPDIELNPLLHQTVIRHMIHGPCGNHDLKSPCMAEKKCTKSFPKNFQKETIMNDNTYPEYRRRSPAQGGRTHQLWKRNKPINIDNGWVIPYSPYLLLKYDSHLNVEILSSVQAVKYMYKYITKGPDRIIMSLKVNGVEQKVNEVEEFLNCRYLSFSESIWKLYNFQIHGRSHAILKLACHLPLEQTVVIKEGKELEALLSGEPETTLTAFFKMNEECSQARKVLYPDFPRHFTWNKGNKNWTKRKGGFGKTLGRLPTVPFNPHTMELYALRVLLHHVQGPRNYEDLKTVNGVLFPSFQSACIELGLMDDEAELDRALVEAASLQFGDQLRNFFCSLLLYCRPSDPKKFWNTHKASLAEDFLKAHGESEAENFVLLYLRNKLALEQLTLKSFSLPEPKDHVSNKVPEIIQRELNFDKDAERKKVLESLETMNDEQKLFFDSVILAKNQDSGGIFFIDAPGGTGKTFVLNTLLSAVRCDGEIALGTAISAVASKLLNNGGTVHSTFKVPIQIKETSMCSFKKTDAVGKLLKRTKMIIIDEVSMGHRFVYEAIDRSLAKLFEVDSPFGNIVVVFAGDWRQCLPIVPRGSDAQIIDACLKSSYLWSIVKVHKLTENMRVKFSGSEDCKAFSEYLLSIGDGLTGIDGTNEMEIPDDMQLPEEAGLEGLIDFVFPDLMANAKDPTWLGERAILCPTNEQADEVNMRVADKFPGDYKIYKSCDTTENNSHEYPMEFLNSMNLPGIAPHALFLKVGMVVMLLRNLDPKNGHCNGVKYIINNLLDHVIEVTSISGSNPGARLFVPRITMIPSGGHLPFEMKRKQFPLRPAFAMTSNKAQGQTLLRVGIYLGQDFFSHGQVYVAISRCGDRQQIKIFTRSKKISQSGKLTMKNVVFTSILTKS